MIPSSPVRNPLIKKIRRRLGAIRRRLRSVPFRTHRQKERLLHDPSLRTAERDLLHQVDSRISYKDGMYKGDGAHYYKVGLSAINCIEGALEAAGIGNPKTILDLPCGHGRVLRFLVHRFPQSSFTACDLDTDGVDFCARTFGVEGIYSHPDLSQLSLGKEFDLIWSGSLITHLDEPKILALLEFFPRHLATGGLAIFTMAGERVVEWMKSGEFNYGIDRQQIPVITGAYNESGYGYTDYPYLPEYGISLTSPEWIRRQVEQLGSLKEVYFKAHGWDDHQDVFGFVKAA